MNQVHSIPQIHVLVKSISKAADETPRYAWEVTMKASDAGGGRVLGYRASGAMLEKPEGVLIKFEHEPQVHDEKRPVWTTMNPTDRPDIRKKIESLARTALGKLKASGKAEFEHKID